MPSYVIRPALLSLVLVGLASFPSIKADQSLPWIDLSGPWKTIDGDDPRYAQPDFDDSQWKTVQLPGMEMNRRLFWLRRAVTLPPGIDTAHLALTVGKISENYRLYINGSLIGGVGDFTRKNSRLARPLTFDLPPLNAPRVQIAVQANVLQMGGSTVWRRYPDPGPYVLTAASNAPRSAGHDYLDHLKSLRTPDGAIAMVLLALGLILLLMFLNERSRPEVAFLALYALLLAYRRGENFFAISPDTTPWRYLFNAMGLLHAALASFILTVFGLRRRWFEVLLWLSALAALVVPLGIIPAALSPFTLFWDYRLPQMLSAVAIVWTAARVRRWPEIFLLTFTGLVYLTEIATEGVQRPLLRPLKGLMLRFGEFESPLHPVLTVIFLLAMVLVLTRRSLSDNVEKQRLAGEVEAARTVQQLMVSSHVEGVDVVYRPASEVGGDFYQVIALPGGARLVAVGDVSGKGLRAAMLVSLISGAFDNRQSDEPGALLSELNRVLCARWKGGFATACVARIEPDGRIVLASAGHPAPWLNGAELAVEAGLPLGLDPSIRYAEQIFRIESGGTLTLVSDGVVEAANPQGELFGFDRTAAISTKSAQEIAEAARAWGQNDDITVVTVRSTA